MIPWTILSQSRREKVFCSPKVFYEVWSGFAHSKISDLVFCLIRWFVWFGSFVLSGGFLLCSEPKARLSLELLWWFLLSGLSFQRQLSECQFSSGCPSSKLLQLLLPRSVCAASRTCGSGLSNFGTARHDEPVLLLLSSVSFV